MSSTLTHTTEAAVPRSARSARPWRAVTHTASLDIYGPFMGSCGFERINATKATGGHGGSS